MMYSTIRVTCFLMLTHPGYHRLVDERSCDRSTWISTADRVFVVPWSHLEYDITQKFTFPETSLSFNETSGMGLREGNVTYHPKPGHLSSLELCD